MNMREVRVACTIRTGYPLYLLVFFGIVIHRVSENAELQYRVGKWHEIPSANNKPPCPVAIPIREEVDPECGF